MRFLLEGVIEDSWNPIKNEGLFATFGFQSKSTCHQLTKMPIDTSEKLISQPGKTYGTHEPTSPRFHAYERTHHETPDYTAPSQDDPINDHFPTEEERILLLQKQSCKF